MRFNHAARSCRNRQSVHVCPGEYSLHPYLYLMEQVRSVNSPTNLHGIYESDFWLKLPAHPFTALQVLTFVARRLQNEQQRVVMPVVQALKCLPGSQIAVEHLPLLEKIQTNADAVVSGSRVRIFERMIGQMLVCAIAECKVEHWDADPKIVWTKENAAR